MKTKMYFWDALYINDEKNSHMLNSDGSTAATEVKYTITAESEERARKLIEENGEDPDDFIIERNGLAIKAMGGYFDEEIRDVRMIKN